MATKESGSGCHKLRKIVVGKANESAKQWASWLTKNGATNGGNSESGESGVCVCVCVCARLWDTVNVIENLHRTVNCEMPFLNVVKVCSGKKF
jgi:hypothetical protein